MRIPRFSYISLVILGLVTSAVAWGQATDVVCDGCVNPNDIADRAVQRSKIANFAVNTPKLNNYAVSTPKIKPEAVTTEKIALGAVTTEKIAQHAVGMGQIDPTQVQVRVDGSCAIGSYVAAVQENGGVKCEMGTDANNNTPYGYRALFKNSTGRANTAIGDSALYFNIDGFANTAIGTSALANTTVGMYNTGVGTGVLNLNASGNFNTAIGNRALSFCYTCDNNIALGYQAGMALEFGDNNIFLGSIGVDRDFHTTRIGSDQTRAFIAGITGTATGGADAVNVVIDSNGQLGTINSSARYKEEIADMADSSDRLLQLRPVSFRYKQPYEDGEKPIQYGLVAEEVAEVFPELVVYDEDGQPQTVKYHILSSLLLNELQKQADKISNLEKLEAEVAALRQLVTRMASLQAVDSELLLADAER